MGVHVTSANLHKHNIFQVLELIIYVLKLHQDIGEGFNDPNVCRVCFQIISRYLEGKSCKNKNYVTQLVKLGFLFTESVGALMCGFILFFSLTIIMLNNMIRCGELLLEKVLALKIYLLL